jgi:PQQ-like domain
MRGRRWIALLAAGALVLVACDWSQPRFGPGRTGFNPFETVVGAGNVARLAPAWSAGLPFPGSDVVVIDGVVIAAVSGVSGGPGSVVARDAGTGAPRWSQSYAGAGCRPVGCFSPSVSLAAADGAVYVAITFTTTGGLFSYDADTGAPIRSYTSASTWGPAVADGRLYAAVYSGSTGIGAWDVATGTPLFGSDDVGGVGSPPLAVGSGRVYEVRNGTLRAFDAAGVAGCTGTPAVCTPLWTAPAVGAPAVAGDLVVAGNQVFAATGCGAATCAPLWTADAGGPVSPAALADGVIYVTSLDRLLAFDAAGCGAPACPPLWVAEDAGFWAPSVANGVVYTADGDRLNAYPAGGCSGPVCPALASLPLLAGAGTGSVVVSGGRVHLALADGTLLTLAVA